MRCSSVIRVRRPLIRSGRRTSQRISPSRVTGARSGPGERNCTGAGSHRRWPLSFPPSRTMAQLTGESLTDWFNQDIKCKILKLKVLLRDWMSKRDDSVPSVSLGLEVQGDLAHGARRGDSGAHLWGWPWTAGDISLSHEKDWSSFSRNNSR